MSDKNSKISLHDELEWVRIFDPVHIPRYLIEQIKDRNYSVDRFYQYLKIVCVEKQNGHVVLNPLNLLYVLVDKQKIVKGVFWGVIDTLGNSLVIQTFSMDDEYWGLGKAIKILENKAKEIQEGAQLDRVYWVTRCPKHSEKYGFKRSKKILMEYVGHGRYSHGERCETSGESSIDDPATTEILKHDTEGNGRSVSRISTRSS